jgi:hypothetical protein
VAIFYGETGLAGEREADGSLSPPPGLTFAPGYRSLSVADTNADGADDLLVGCPDEEGRTGDLGAMYLFIARTR